MTAKLDFQSDLYIFFQYSLRNLKLRSKFFRFLLFLTSGKEITKKYIFIIFFLIDCNINNWKFLNLDTRLENILTNLEKNSNRNVVPFLSLLFHVLVYGNDLILQIEVTSPTTKFSFYGNDVIAYVIPSKFLEFSSKIFNPSEISSF